MTIGLRSPLLLTVCGGGLSLGSVFRLKNTGDYELKLSGQSTFCVIDGESKEPGRIKP